MNDLRLRTASLRTEMKSQLAQKMHKEVVEDARRELHLANRPMISDHALLIALAIVGARELAQPKPTQVTTTNAVGQVSIWTVAAILAI